MTNDEILQAAKEADLSKYLRSYSEFDEIAEQAGCDMSAMDGREYETMWCDRAQFEKLCLGIAAIIEKRTIERCATIADRVEELADALNDKISDDDDHNEGRSEYVMGKAQAANRIAAAIRKLGEQ